MLRLIAVAVIATAATTVAAVADEKDDYVRCMLDHARIELKAGSDAAGAYDKAFEKCPGLARLTNDEADGLGDYIELQIAEMTGRSETEYEPTQVAAAPERRIENVSGFTPLQPYNLYNARTGFLCRFPSDAEPMRQLVETGRLEQARQKRGCVIVEEPIEVEQIRKFGWTIQVRYVDAKGDMVEAFTSSQTFRAKAGWREIGVE